MLSILITLQALRDKISIASQILGEELRDWI